MIFLIQDINFAEKQLKHPEIVVPILLLSVLSCLVLWVTVRGLKGSSPPVSVNSVSNRSSELINYSIPYMISFFAMDLGRLDLSLSFGFFMLVMYWLTLKTHNIFSNPILAAMGYNIYDVRYERNGNECQNFLLVKGPRLRKEELCRIVQISEQLYVVTERDPKV